MNFLKKIFIYLYIFFIFYMPRISDLFIGLNIEVFSVLLLLIMFIPWIIICKNKSSLLRVNKNIFILIIGIVLSAFYFAIRAALSSYNIRIMQNLFIIVQIIHVLIIIDFMKYIGYTKDYMICILLNLALFQSFIAIIMLLFPTTKNIALSLYYLGKEENMFISRMRVYGISGDYTFFTPIYHGILASIAFFYSIFKDRRYFLYLPFIILIISLNGRFGLLIFFISLIIITLNYISKGKVLFKIIKKSILILIITIGAMLLLKIISPYTYEWIMGGIKDTINLILYNEKTGNYVALADKHLSFPKGIGFIFGEGYRLFGGQAKNMGYNSSDIGYVNDIFMGGIIYIFILYGTILRFLSRKCKASYFKNKNDYNLYKIICKYLIIALLISNYKGESMRGGLILLSTIYIKLVLSINYQKN